MFRGYVFAHHQEHLTVFTASGNIHPMLLPAGVMVELERRLAYGRHVLELLGPNLDRDTVVR